MHGFLNKLLKNKVKYVDKIRLKIDEKFRKNLCQKAMVKPFLNE